MRKLIAYLLLAGQSSFLPAAVITSQTSGSFNHNDTGAWVGGVLPGAGDRAIITGTASITSPPGTTWNIGDGTGNAALTIQSSNTTPALIINGRINFNGWISQGDRPVIANAGADIRCAHTSTAYWWSIGNANNQVNATFTANGTGWGAGEFVTFDKDSGAVNCWSLGQPGGAGAINDGGKMQFNFVKINNWGSTGTSNVSVEIRQNLSTNVTYWRNVRVSNSGLALVFFNHADSYFEMSNVVFEANMLHAINYTLQLRPAVARGTGTRLIQNSGINGATVVSSNGTHDTGLTFRNVIFRSRNANGVTSFMTDNPNQIAVRASFDNCLFWSTSAAGSYSYTGASGPFTDVIFLKEGNTAVQDFDVGRVSPTSGFATVINGAVYEYRAISTVGQPNNFGDGLVIDRKLIGAPTIHDVSRALYLPNENNGINGPAVTVADLPDGDLGDFGVYFHDNTVYLGTAPGHVQKPVIIGETMANVTVAPDYKWFNNIYHSPVSGAHKYAIIEAQAPSPTFPANSIKEAQYNVGFGVTGDPYDNLAGLYSTTPGTGDTTSDPKFYDQTRDVDAFKAWRGVTGTDWSNLTSLMVETAAQHPGYTPDLTVLNLYNFIRGGYAPQNHAIFTAGKTGSYAGAVKPTIIRSVSAQ